MPAPIDFYFDFSSPYGFLASEKIEALAARHGRDVSWRPMLLGVVFKQTGAAPLTQIPLKGEYSRRDMVRSARFHGIDGFRMPSTFPIATQAPARIVLWLQIKEPSMTSKVVHAQYRAFFVAVAARCGVDAVAARAAIDDLEIKDALKKSNEQAIAAGAFGSPFIVVDGEPFWGMDRLDQVDRWLETGGW